MISGKRAVARITQMCNIIEKASEIIRNSGGGRVLVGSAVFKTVSRALITFLGGFDSHAPPPIRFWQVLSNDLCACPQTLKSPTNLE